MTGYESSTRYVLRLLGCGARELWADENDQPTDNLQCAATYGSATQATLRGLLLPFSFSVQPMRASDSESTML